MNKAGKGDHYQTSIFTCVNKINICLLSFCSSREIGKMKSCKFRVYHTLAVRQHRTDKFSFFPVFAFFLITFVLLLFTVAFFIFQLVLSYVFSYQFMNSVPFPRQGLHSEFCILITNTLNSVDLYTQR